MTERQDAQAHPDSEIRLLAKEVAKKIRRLNPAPTGDQQEDWSIIEDAIRAAAPAPLPPPQDSLKFRNEPIHTHLNAQSWLKSQCEHRWVPTFAYELVVQLLDDYYQFRTAKNG